MPDDLWWSFRVTPSNVRCNSYAVTDKEALGSINQMPDFPLVIPNAEQLDYNIPDGGDGGVCTEELIDGYFWWDGRGWSVPKSK